jgi:hypothetical protein
MDAKLFRGWLHQLGELSDRQRDQLKHRLLGGEASDDARDWINRRAQESLACPHCQAAHVQRWGRESQRYRAVTQFAFGRGTAEAVTFASGTENGFRTNTAPAC